MNVYVYCIRQNYTHRSSITGRYFDNPWFNLALDGAVTIKGSNGNGYAWDGCSPKFKFKDLYFGTAESVLNHTTGQSKTYYASLVHDVFYQFAKQLRPHVKRREVDQEFYRLLTRDHFAFAKLYYLAVRALGWLWWYK